MYRTSNQFSSCSCCYLSVGIYWSQRHSTNIGKVLCNADRFLQPVSRNLPRLSCMGFGPRLTSSIGFHVAVKNPRSNRPEDQKHTTYEFVALQPISIRIKSYILRAPSSPYLENGLDTVRSISTFQHPAKGRVDPLPASGCFCQRSADQAVCRHVPNAFLYSVGVHCVEAQANRREWRLRM